MRRAARLVPDEQEQLPRQERFRAGFDSATPNVARIYGYWLGQLLIISVACYDDEALGKRLAAEYTAAAWHNHTPADVESFFAGLELVGPGVTEAQTWRGWMPDSVLLRREGHVLAGVGRVVGP